MKRRWRLRRLVQLATGIHRIHHIRYGYGWTLPFSTREGYFPDYQPRSEPANPWQPIDPAHYHDCTRVGVY